MGVDSVRVPVRRYLDLISGYLRTRKSQFVTLAVLLFSGIGLQLVIPQVTRRFIDMAQAGTPYRALLGVAFAFIGASLVQQIVTVLGRYVGEKLAWSATNDMRIDLARHTLRLDMSFHNQKTPGEMIERVDGDLLKISEFFSQLVVIVVGSILLLIGVLVALFLEDARLGGVFVVFAGATIYLFVVLRNIAVPYDKARRDKVTEMFGYIEERLAGTEDIRSSGAVDFVLTGLYKAHYFLYGPWQKAELLHVTIRLIAGVTMVLGYAIAFVGGYYLHRAGLITIGSVYLIVHYTELLARPIRMLVQQVQNLQEIGANVQRVTELFSEESRIVEPTVAVSPATGPATVAYQNVVFGYNPDDPVLHDVTFEVRPGSTVGVLGRTGSGKTTLARLIFRLYDPQSGAVLVDGHDVREYRLNELRSRVAMVTQDVQIFQATVRQNLTFFDTSVPDERLHEVIEELGLSRWLASLPAGLDSRVEQGGRGLSAGQAQLLAFTRVFLRDPGLVILDEASSRLDPATEGMIEHVVDRLLVNRSAIIIAHRLATVFRADDILILDDGRIAEYGPRVDLAADEGSRFAGLLRTGMEDVLA
jgi:ATP-binding cassette subfamily B protein